MRAIRWCVLGLIPLLSGCSQTEKQAADDDEPSEEDIDIQDKPTLGEEDVVVDEPLNWARMEDLLASSGIDDMEMALPGAASQLEISNPDAVTAYVGFTPGFEDDSPVLWMDDMLAESLFLGDDPSLDPDGLYSLTELAVAEETCFTAGIRYTPLMEVQANGGGLCGTLSVAHSLVYRLGVVRKEWATDQKLDAFWDPDFLRKVNQAGGPILGRIFGVGALDDDYEDAHEADWNTEWVVKPKTDWEELDYGSCASIKTWCDKMQLHVGARGDDCILRLQGGSILTVGHAMSVNSVSYTSSPPCRCVVKVTNTALQEPPDEPPYHMIQRLPGDIGVHNWKFLQAGITMTSSTGKAKKNWNDNGYSAAYFRCWDEEPRSGESGVGSDETGEPGSALD